VRYLACGLCALLLLACSPGYKPVGSASGETAYDKARDECSRDESSLNSLNAAARQELFDDCMATQGFVRTN